MDSSLLLVARCPSSERLVTRISRHLITRRTSTPADHMGGEKSEVAPGTHNPTEWLSTSTETVERHTGSGSVDCWGRQTVRDKGVGEYNDTPQEAGEDTPPGGTGRSTGGRESRHLGEKQHHPGKGRDTRGGGNHDFADSSPMATAMWNTCQDGPGTREMLVGGGQLH